MTIRFLALDEVIALHTRPIELYGGAAGVRDLGLVDFAIAAPQASVGGIHLHATLPEMAAAYLFHLAQNHAFVDGNKRVAAVSMIVFLRMNGLTPKFSPQELVELTMAVASGKASKSDAAVFVAAHVEPTRSPGSTR